MKRLQVEQNERRSFVHLWNLVLYLIAASRYLCEGFDTGISVVSKIRHEDLLRMMNTSPVVLFCLSLLRTFTDVFQVKSTLHLMPGIKGQPD